MPLKLGNKRYSLCPYAIQFFCFGSLLLQGCSVERYRFIGELLQETKGVVMKGDAQGISAQQSLVAEWAVAAKVDMESMEDILGLASSSTRSAEGTAGVSAQSPRYVSVYDPDCNPALPNCPAAQQVLVNPGRAAMQAQQSQRFSSSNVNGSGRPDLFWDRFLMMSLVPKSFPPEDPIDPNGALPAKFFKAIFVPKAGASSLGFVDEEVLEYEIYVFQCTAGRSYWNGVIDNRALDPVFYAGDSCGRVPTSRAAEALRHNYIRTPQSLAFDLDRNYGRLIAHLSVRQNNERILTLSMNKPYQAGLSFSQRLQQYGLNPSAIWNNDASPEPSPSNFGVGIRGFVTLENEINENLLRVFRNLTSRLFSVNVRHLSPIQRELWMEFSPLDELSRALLLNHPRAENLANKLQGRNLWDGTPPPAVTPENDVILNQEASQLYSEMPNRWHFFRASYQLVNPRLTQFIPQLERLLNVGSLSLGVSAAHESYDQWTDGERYRATH